jgi:hypothetical protein
MSDTALESLERVDFDWTTRLDAVWRDNPFDVPELNEQIKRGLLREVIRLAGTDGQHSPLGRVITAPAGSGKTHLLGTLRHKLAGVHRSGFILVDMTDVRDFWETVLLGYLRSLQHPLRGHKPQYRLWLENLVQLAGLDGDANRFCQELTGLTDRALVRQIEKVLQGLHLRYPRDTLAHQDVVRCLFAWGARDFTLVNLADTWLQAQELEDDERRRLGLRPTGRQLPERIVQGLTWVASLYGPTLLALDQLDSIVEQNTLLSIDDGDEGEITHEQRTAKAIIEGIAGGLSALIDYTHRHRTLTVVACLERTWESLRTGSLASHLDRFARPESLDIVQRPEWVERLIETRLQAAYAETRFKPPYPTWPYRREALARLEGLRPREILKRAEDHRRLCLRQGHVDELTADLEAAQQAAPPTDDDALDALDQELERLVATADPATLLEVENEDTLGRLIQTGCRLILQELPRDTAQTVELEVEFGRTSHYPPLHARLRFSDSDTSSGEHHVCLRTLQQVHHTAYTARLNAAVTAAGIEPSLSFRRLVLIRTAPPLKGGATGAKTQQFLAAGGQFVDIEKTEVARLWALDALERQHRTDFHDWLRTRQPLSRGAFFPTALPELFASPANDPPDQSTPPNEASPGERRWPPEADKTRMLELAEWVGTPAELRHIELGYESTTEQPYSITLADLTRHLVIAAGAGMGKTTLLLRLIEAAVGHGVSVTAIDDHSALARFGASETADAPGTRPRIWTPGAPEPGRPLHFAALPDLAAIAGSPAESVIEDLITRTMERWLGSGLAATKRRLLRAAIEKTLQAGDGFPGLGARLRELPEDLGGNNAQTRRSAQQIAEGLDQAAADRPWIDHATSDLATDAFANDAPATQVNILSLVGLETESARSEVLELLMRDWLVRQWRDQAGGLNGLGGLLASDGVRELSNLLNRLPQLLDPEVLPSAGLLISVPDPRDLESLTGARCAHWLYGGAQGPQAMQRLQSHLQACDPNQSGRVNRLKTGEFILCNALSWPANAHRIRATPSLSPVPEGGRLTTEELLRQARGDDG